MIGAAMVAGLAAAIFCGPAPQRRLTSPRERRRTFGRIPIPILIAGSVVVLVGLAFPGAALLAAAAGVVAATVGFLVRAHIRRRRHRKVARECARATRVLASLMAAGKIPTAALEDAASDSAVLAPAAAAARLGGDVGEALARSAELPGQASLRHVAAAWLLSERTGAPVAGILGGVADNLRREQQVAAVIDAELAAARTSGHIMAALPFLAVGLGFVVGVNTVRFLFGDPLGQVLVLVGVCLTATGVVWIDALSRSRSLR